MENGTLAANQAKEVFTVHFDSPENDPAAIADSLGFKPAEAGELEGLCDQVIANNPAEVAAVKAGNEKLLNFLTGQVMKAAATKPNPKPNPKQVTELLRARLL
jgi:aspartyl-tRNA(Asn)/glutamyl-tRNA(Gln) amidotransferase subunit B